MQPRWLMIAAVLLLSGVFFFPLWQITLEAAQFPGGLRLNIWINKFSGDEGGGDIIKNINILNHYIGMKYIEPDSIPELKYFPYVIFAMMGLGLIAALINKAWAYISWVVIMVLLSIAGMYDFYLWMYDYGHNLDPKAPIKIEGMTYMPPLFGEKDLLNFYVKSYPHIGTLFLMLSIVTAALAAWMGLKSRSHANN
jgi:copper chaperone NosL